jgi:hypothetical protein
MSKYFWHQRVSQLYMKAVKVKLLFLLRQFVLILWFFDLQIDISHSRHCQFDKDKNICELIRYHRIQYLYVKARFFFLHQLVIYQQDYLSPLMLWVRIPLRANCARHNVMWFSFSVTCNRFFVFSVYSSFRNQ